MAKVNCLDVGKSHVLLGDCVNMMKRIPTDTVDCIITDPPYNLGLFMHQRNTNLKKMRDNQFAYAGWDNMQYHEWKRNMSKFRLYRFCPWIAHANLLAKYHRATVHYSK